MSITKPDGYVYRITNNINGKTYIGSHAGHNPKYMGSGVALNRAYVKYGSENFTKEIVLHCEQFQEVEEQMLVVLNAANDPQMYNLINSGTGGTLGLKHSTATRSKMSSKASGTSNPNYGKSASIETRRLMSKSRSVPKPLTTCPHCLKVGGNNLMSRYHFDNCKHKLN